MSFQVVQPFTRISTSYLVTTFIHRPHSSCMSLILPGGDSQVKREIYKPKSKLPESAFKSQETQPKEDYAPPKPVGICCVCFEFTCKIVMLLVLLLSPIFFVQKHCRSSIYADHPIVYLLCVGLRRRCLNHLTKANHDYSL